MNRRGTLSSQSYVRPDIEALEEYIPVEPPEVLAERFGLDPARIIKLDANENPYGPSPRVWEMLARAEGIHQYPDALHREIRGYLSGYTGLDADWLMVGNGSDELIDLLLRLLLQPGDEIIDCVPTFAMYRFSAEVCGGRAVAVPRRADFSLNLPAIADAVTDRTRAIFVASPNNPTGNLLGRPELEALLELGPPVVLDEAYYEFAGVSYFDLVPERENLVVLRTFSKWAGLAGLRVGYGAFPEWLRRNLWKIKPPYNVGVAAQVAVRATFADLPYLQDTVARIIAERSRLLAGLRALPFLAPLPSAANFIYCPVVQGEARDVYAHLAQRGIFVRYYDRPFLRNALRISIGRPEENDTVLGALAEYGRRTEDGRRKDELRPAGAGTPASSVRRPSETDNG
jgi:histidinol-phosphate aminotransferase